MRKVLYRSPRAAICSVQRSSIAGFTLLETLIIIVLVGVMAAMVSPSWFAYFHTWSLNDAHDRAYQTIQDAQSRARRDQVAWQASFRDMNGNLQWASHPVSLPPATATWNTFSSSTTIDGSSRLLQANGIYQVQFDHNGNVHGQLGRLILTSRFNQAQKRCIMVSTLIGALRKGQFRPDAPVGKTCML